MIRVIVEGDKPEEVYETIVYLSGTPSDDTLDDVRSDYMKLHQNVMRIESKIIDPMTMFNEVYKEAKRRADDKAGNKKTGQNLEGKDK